jgi:enterochelin esterase-like enzyme
MFFLSPSGTWYRNTTVLRLFDNLIASHEMPVTLAAFVTVANKQEMESSPKAWVDEWADKFFPALKQMFPKLSDSPAMHAAAGGSSWGLGSFHLGWYRPDFLGKVLTHSGSFVCFGVLKDYPAAIRAADKKPLRIAMTVGDCDIVGMTCSDACNTRSLCSVDASNCHADWQTTNRNVAMAFADKGYPYRLVRGSGGHQEAFWTSLLGDDLRWLWRPAVCGM